MTTLNVKLPSIADIRSGAAIFGTDSAYHIVVCNKSHCLAERTYHVASNKTPIVLRKDGATSRNRETFHQLPTTGLSESESAHMNDTARFLATGLFSPVALDDAAIANVKPFYKANVLLQNALTREFCRRAVAGDDTPFSALTIMTQARLPGTPLNTDMLAAAAAAPRGRAASMLSKISAGDDVCQQLLADFAVVGAVIVPVLGELRGKATAYRLNAAWLPALAEAASVNGALPAPAIA